MKTRISTVVLTVLALIAIPRVSAAQNLFEPEPAAAPVKQPAAPTAQPGPKDNPAPGEAVAPPAQAAPQAEAVDPRSPNPAAPALQGLSMFVVLPPTPKKIGKHDLIEVIINESSVQKMEQKMDTKKNYDLRAELSQFPSLQALFEGLALKDGIGSNTPNVGVNSRNQFKGEGKFDRKDQVTARLTATVIDVKPNGTLVLEARESVESDRETKTLVLSGVCRQEDVTKNNTVQSAQLANLTIRIRHEGDVKDSAEKGLIPRIFETIFNF